MSVPFDPYISLWGLVPDGSCIITHSSKLMPVRWNGMPAMLKIAEAPEERVGALLMSWWNGEGTARVLAQDGNALLMERAQGTLSLTELAQGGHDDTASRIICNVVAKLHAQANKLPPHTVVPLARWFCDLDLAAARHGGVLPLAAHLARNLLAAQQDVVVLHGDIHHGNILNFSERGWLAIDPKGLKGDRGFDYANLFCNPDHQTATASGRLSRQVCLVAEVSGVTRIRLLQWILAYAGLSAAWTLNAGAIPHTALAVAELASAELAKAQ